jgi:hypothetical protein
MADNAHDILRSLVAKLRCKPGWSFRLKDETMRCGSWSASSASIRR